MLKVHLPDTRGPERNYIVGVLLGDFLGVDYEVVIEARETVSIVTANGLEISLSDECFALSDGDWLTAKMLPSFCKSVVLDMQFSSDVLTIEPTFPLIGWGNEFSEEAIAEVNVRGVKLNVDIFGVAFFFLSRCEEYFCRNLDRYQRFCSKESFAGKHGLLDRPVVNEYLELLWATLKYLSPDLQRKPRQYRMLLSHDVDIPFDLAFSSLRRFAKSALGDIVKRHDPALALRRVRLWPKVRSGAWEEDPYYTFDWILDQSEKRGLRSSFYFLAGRTDESRDGAYEIDHPAIRSLIRKCASRGHEIGLHPSYNTFRNPSAIALEFARLKKVCEEEGVKQEQWGGRHHYLRWSVSETPLHWESAGLNYDSTLGFADRVGFRCGTCYEFPLFDLLERRELTLRERPLLVMDVTLISDQYMGGIGAEFILDRISYLKNSCRILNGDFTLLWHNDRLSTVAMRSVYKEVLSCVTD